MPLLRTRHYLTAILAISVLASPALSATPAPNNPYVALSMLSGSAVTAEAGSVNDSQMDDGTTAHGSMLPLWVALGVVFAGWAWTFLDNDDDNNDEAVSPISPA